MHFHRFWCISGDFIWFRRFSMDFKGPGFAASATLCHRNDAPKETFTRFQLAAVSSIFIDFWRFHAISWNSSIFMDFDVFLRISYDFVDFLWISRARGSQPLPPFAIGMMPLKKPLLDSSWLLFHRFSSISEDLMRFHKIHAFSSILMYFWGFHTIS